MFVTGPINPLLNPINTFSFTNFQKLIFDISYRADIKWQDEYDEEAEVPGQKRPKQDHSLMLPQIPKAMEEVQSQEENNNHHYRQRHSTHGDDQM